MAVIRCGAIQVEPRAGFRCGAGIGWTDEPN
jgi:hypothetical protein